MNSSSYASEGSTNLRWSRARNFDSRPAPRSIAALELDAAQRKARPIEHPRKLLLGRPQLFEIEKVHGVRCPEDGAMPRGSVLGYWKCGNQPTPKPRAVAAFY